jgi:hypothetical protein
MQGWTFAAASPLSVLVSNSGRVKFIRVASFLCTYESGSDATLIRMVADLG